MREIIERKKEKMKGKYNARKQFKMVKIHKRIKQRRSKCYIGNL